MQGGASEGLGTFPVPSVCQTWSVETAENFTGKLTVVVTHYRTPDILRSCLARLSQHAEGARVIVVDADSGDGTPQMLRRDYPWVTVKAAPNHSMANAVNTGLKAARTFYILQMNADVFLEAATLPDLLTVLADPRVGMVGPCCRTPAGRWQDQGLFYRPYYALLARSRRSSVPVPWLSGCCTLVKREVVERVGGLDSSLRFYNEDIDWCHRIRSAGYSCHLAATEVTHLGGSSTPADPRFWLEGLRGGMQLSRRYHSPLYRRLHRWGMLGYSLLASRRETNEAKRRNLRHLRELFAYRRFDESPFGPTLNEADGRALE